MRCKRVARLMRAAGTRRLPATAPAPLCRTRPASGAPICSGVTSRHRPPVAGTSVIFPHCVGGASSYLPLVGGGNLYLATVIDCVRPVSGLLGAA